MVQKSLILMNTRIKKSQCSETFCVGPNSLLYIIM
jgi:hypothetical protein